MPQADTKDPYPMGPQEGLPDEDDFQDDAPVIPRRPMKDTADMDITPMIDIVFLLLIFFLFGTAGCRAEVL